MTTTPINERSIQRVLYYDLMNTCHPVLPNYTPREWHECDLWAVTKAGYAREYEIKLSVRDFKADVKKNDGQDWRRTAPGQYECISPRRKHDRLASGDTKGPVQFWFVTPAGLLTTDMLPPWAGLIEIQQNPAAGLRLINRTNGPRLHSEKVDLQTTHHALSVCCYRFWNERNKADQLRDDRRRAREMEGKEGEE